MLHESIRHDKPKINNLAFLACEILVLDEVRQKCFVNVAEEGTKAAAVTAIAYALGCAQDPQPAPKVITFNRPFLWVIGDLTTPAAPGSWGCARNRDTPARRKKSPISKKGLHAGEQSGIFPPHAASAACNLSMGRFPSGQRGQTVNLLAFAFDGSNPSLPSSCGGSSVGRATP